MAEFPRSPFYARVSAKPRLRNYTWVQSATTLGIPEPPAPMPFRQLDWPVTIPSGQYAQDWFDTGIAWTTTPQPPPPNMQRDWPNPRGPRRGRVDWQHYILPWQEPSPTPPLATYDWPVPRGPRRSPPSWTASFNLCLTLADTRAPILWRRKPPLDFTAAIGSQPLGGRPPPAPEELPFRNDWVNPRLAKRNPQDWSATSLPWLQAPPPNRDWPNPTRRQISVVWDWIAPSNFLLLSVGQPFAQSDWPLPPRSKTRLLPTWLDSFKLPLQGVLPPRQLDWPVPKGRRSNDLRGYFLHNLAITTIPPKPYNQYDWPVPKGPRQPVITARDFVHGLIPPIPPVYDRALTLENERVRVRFLGRLTGRVRFLKNEIRR